MRQRDFTRSQILEILQADPTKSLREICAITHQRAGNVMYHIHRIEKAGLVTWQGSAKDKPRSSWHVKHAAMPKLTQKQLDQRVAMVVAKALNNPQAVYSEDASMKILPSGIKVIIRTPSLWGSKAHQG